jgi:hypothetical protein
MPILRKPNHEAYAQARARGLNCADAYREAAGSLGGKHENGHTHGYEWERCRGVRERIQELQKQNAKKSAMTREEAIKWLTNLIQTPIGSVGPDSSLVQSYEVDAEGRVKLRMADKISGMQTLCRMTGWNEPNQVRLSTADSLSEYLLALRAKPIGGTVLSFEHQRLNLENGAAGEESRCQGGEGVK